MNTTTKVALVTGAGSGIGRALALELQASNFKVYVTVRRQNQLAEQQALGLSPLLLDVNDQNAVHLAISQIEQEQQQLDLLINNAGFGAMGPVLDCSEAELQQQFQTNVFSIVSLTRRCLPLLAKSGGTVANIGSVSADFVTPFAGVYCASKAALHALNTALRLELAPFGIHTVLVQPGAIASSFGNTAISHAEQLLSEQSPWWPLREGIRLRAAASQQKPTPAHQFAHKVVKKLQQNPPPRRIRAGYGSVVLPLLAALLPEFLLDAILRRKFVLPKNGSLKIKSE
ncbi:SDR family oxidoreductase [Rheinheimera sp.]|uniref:SDR family oxidoreductase n=1 Tax=Rheinheimera sp. TaxID=1869214 RepID=UPI0027BAC16C|nr:SDR family oxidoreductase [Rheinheimera sp.]